MKLTEFSVSDSKPFSRLLKVAGVTSGGRSWFSVKQGRRRCVLQVIRSYDRSPVFLLPRGSYLGHGDCVL
ncbi:hypothetical protein LINGRAPRIM_LOCUS3431 [Linum grandiflorum]